MSGLRSSDGADAGASPSTGPEPSGPRSGGAWDALADAFLTAECRTDPDLGRRARLVTRFGFLGVFFGALFALFYLAIGHPWGAAIVVACSAGFGAAPWLMRLRGSVRLGGQLLTGLMLLGFTALCAVEGGMHGHAIAWLASVPLCALLLVGKQTAKVWAYGSAVSAGGIVVAGLAGIPLPSLYPAEWDYVVTAAGYLSLIAFLFLLGIVFEDTRVQAFREVEEARRNLESSHERLVHLNQEKNEFLGIAAHDLKNPLATILAYAGLLKHSPDPAEVREIAETIGSDVTRMTHLINNLLDSNAIEEGRFTSNLKRCSLQALALRSAAQNRANAGRKDIRIEVEDSTDSWVEADENATLQILDNLVSNAVKYSPPGSLVRIVTHGGATDDGDFRTVSVRDQGPGLSAADQARLFQKFVRLSARPTAGESSNGLGLSIVKRLAESMGGSVACQSELGFGCTFTLRLRRWPGEVPEMQSPPTACRPAGQSQRLGPVAPAASGPGHSPDVRANRCAASGQSTASALGSGRKNDTTKPTR